MALAIVLGGVIGLDREISDKPAGLRTNMLVAAAAALLVSLGNVTLDYFTRGGNNIQADPIRILEAVITGVSFIGAGTILHNRDKPDVRWLTTAASLLLSAAVALPWRWSSTFWPSASRCW